MLDAINLALEENAADLTGVELAWDALATSQPDLPKESKQAFFQGWAQLWRDSGVPTVRWSTCRRSAMRINARPAQAKPEQQVSIWRAQAAAGTDAEVKK